MKYRLYIDESGSHEYSNKDSIKFRYLCLVGVIVSVEEYEGVLQPGVRKLKQLFSVDPDELTVLHRDEIVHKQGPFAKLLDQEFCKNFDESFLCLCSDAKYTLCAVVLDKTSHFEKYSTSAYHPYHYCLNVILERYVFFLEERGAVGDVMSESRGKKEDMALRKAYSAFYENGTYFCENKRVHSRLTSKDIKLRTKDHGIEGLEFADLLVLASKYFILHKYGRIANLTDNFCFRIIQAIRSKFRNNGGSTTKGFGIKLIE